MMKHTVPDAAPMAPDIAGERVIHAREAYRERERFVRNLLAEEDSASFYEALAAREGDLGQADTYRQLAARGRGHATYWRDRLCTAGYAVPKHALSLRTHLLIHLARWFGSGFVSATIADAPKDSRIVLRPLSSPRSALR